MQYNSLKLYSSLSHKKYDTGPQKSTINNNKSFDIALMNISLKFLVSIYNENKYKNKNQTLFKKW